VLGLGLGC
jgi:hypothetical protein